MPKLKKADPPVQVRMSKSLDERVRTVANRERRSLTDQLDMIVEAGLKAMGHGGSGTKR